jgi:hypothetical protein
LASPAENSKGGLAHKALLIASARAADDEGIRCKMNDFFDFLFRVRFSLKKHFVSLSLLFGKKVSKILSASKAPAWLRGQRLMQSGLPLLPFPLQRSIVSCSFGLTRGKFKRRLGAQGH